MASSAPLSPEAAWARAKMDSLFFHWLSSDSGASFIKSMCEDIKAGRPISTPATANAAASNAPSPIDAQSSPQRTARKLLTQDEALGNLGGQGSPTSSNASDSPSSTRSNRGSSMHRKKSNLSISSSASSMSSTQPSGSPAASASTLAEERPKLARIPSFLGKNKRSGKRGPIEEDKLENRLPEFEEIFAGHVEGITAEDLLPICKSIVQFPSALNVPLFRRIRMMNRIWKNQPISSNAEEVVAAIREAQANPKVPSNPALLPTAEEEQLIELETGRITLEELCEFWRREIEPFDRDERFFRLVKQPSAKYIKARDFFPIVRELIDGHPGLEFLESTPEFQEKYARTVVARIMHRVNSSWTGEITPRELKRSDFLHYLSLADEEEEINAINEYFSYEHFYVIYCKFWELDSDHDFLLSREDIFRHGGHSLTKHIVDRIFQQPCKAFTSGVKGKMGFEDFCFFILCEEDKTNATSIRYWFSLVDLDGDGYLSKWEIRTFYDEQLKRMRSLGHEEVLLDDIYSQMRDCLGELTGKSILFSEEKDEEHYADLDSDEEWVIGLQEFLKPNRLEISGQFFNLLFNLNKFIANESRDPFSTRLMQGEQPMTDWDRYALAEYSRLASAEEARGGGGNQNSNYSSTSSSGTGNASGGRGFNSEHNLGSRMVDSDSESAEEDEDDDDGEEEDLDDSEDSGDFNTKGLNTSSPLFTGNGNGRPDAEVVGNRMRQLSDEVSEDYLDKSTEEGSDDGLEPLERTHVSSVHYRPTDDQWRMPESKHNLSRFWLQTSAGGQ